MRSLSSEATVRTVLRHPARLHRHSAWRRSVAAFLAAVWIAGCASPAAVRPIPELGAQFAPERDEEKIWEQARGEEREILKKVKLVEDPLLADYVESLGQGLVDPAVRDGGRVQFRFRVIEDPTLNAFAFPHGSVYVHSGLVARTQNEAQLAMVLGHEIAHVEHRHALRHQRSARRKALGFGIAAVAGSILIAHEAGQRAEKGDISSAAVISRTADIILGVGLQLAFIAAIQGYGRGLERESDEAGLAKMVAKGYDPSQAPQLFALLLKERPDAGKMERFFFSSHPANEERQRTAEELVGTRYAAQAKAGGKVSSPQFDTRRRIAVREDARLNRRRGAWIWRRRSSSRPWLLPRATPWRSRSRGTWSGAGPPTPPRRTGARPKTEPSMPTPRRPRRIRPTRRPTASWGSSSSRGGRKSAPASTWSAT